MKCWWLAAASLAACANDDKPDLDATGTLQVQLTYGSGTCQKTGSETLAIHVAKNELGTYDLAQDNPGRTLGRDVMCGPESCRIQLFENWTDADLVSYDVQGILTLGSDHSVTGTGTYRAVGSTIDCEQALTFAGSLQR
jgi:hypothetical protein